MASVYKRGNRWWIRYRDAHRQWHSEPCTATSKTEAKELAIDVERRGERQRRGLEPIPPRDGGGTLGDLFRWWLETYSRPRTSYVRDQYTVTKHFLSAPIARLKLVEITPGVIERFLQAKATTHGPQTLNHLRRYVLTAFNCARRAERYMGPNPAKDVLRRTVPKRKPDFLRVDEVPRVLAALEDRWRPLFAAAIYTGLRKGELLGLTKAKVDIRERLLYVARSYDRLTNKSNREEVIPIATEVIPFLEIAIQASPSELVFPAPDGSMMREDVDIENVLRRALGRAGIVLGYQHVCRRKGCGHSAQHQDPELRLCPTCSMKLWPKALVRKIRFHDLRHTTASLLLMAGANPAAVQRILRHSDPRITTEVYGHLVPDYLRAEIDRLRFGIAPPPKPSSDSHTSAGLSTGLATSVLQRGPIGLSDEKSGPSGLSDFEELSEWARQDANLLPPAPETVRDAARRFGPNRKPLKLRLYLDDPVAGRAARNRQSTHLGIRRVYRFHLLPIASGTLTGGAARLGLVGLVKVREFAEASPCGGE
jgi:integrase